jgi:hypothetical protein
MEISPQVLTTILTSALISSVVTFLLKIIFESRQKHRFDIELEKLKYEYELQLERLKSEMGVNTSIKQVVIERRLQNYPKLVELIYRTRNMSREIATTGVNPILLTEFQARSGEIEKLLYQSRIDLERDRIFAEVHGYKTLLKTLGRAAEDISFLKSQDDATGKFDEAVLQLRNLYDKIESSHRHLIDKVSAKAIASDVDKASDDTVTAPNNSFNRSAG